MNATMNPVARIMRFLFFAGLVFLFVLWSFYHFLGHLGLGLGLHLGLEWEDLDVFFWVLVGRHFTVFEWPLLKDFVTNPEHFVIISIELGFAFVVGLFCGWLQDFAWKRYLKNHMRN